MSACDVCLFRELHRASFEFEVTFCTLQCKLPIPYILETYHQHNMQIK